jgi:hypothetical protein
MDDREPAQYGVPFQPEECFACGATESTSWIFIGVENERGIEPGIYCVQCGLDLLIPDAEATNW